MDQLIDKIPFVNHDSRIKKIKKGFSADKKFVVDNRYLIRVFSSEQEASREKEFKTIMRLQTYSKYVPEAVEFGSITDTDYSYMILTYITGKDGEAVLQCLTEDEQYEAGIQAGMELKKLHAFPAPENIPSWYEIKRRKSNKYLSELEAIDVDVNMKRMLRSYIKENEQLLYNRPNTFQHDDFHPANLLINEGRFAGIIDFQRIDWGDPIHDLQKLGFFSNRVSNAFTRGIVDGYNENDVSIKFWELYALYSAMHIVSSLVWGRKMGNYQTMLTYSLDVIRDHKNYTTCIPAWYR
ncbi:MAG: aminoglycoside phosphotransferase family protein [Bacillota bacterium]|uniref:aminoglycoside phosphotransferase family protein n=1 Tax=Virgibacillus salarius TaxID=447199 RepID=UPI000417F145|nr:MULTISPECIES: aminoglycoside phosphotransferase family protein [Bacillaceae]WBX82050.1 aminoglycoside phosphotransferase family protein [Virgibacillus salarius]